MVLTFPVITFGAIAIVVGTAAVVMPLIKSGVTRSRKRRRSKNRRNRKGRSHSPRQRIDITGATTEADTTAGSKADTG